METNQIILLVAALYLLVTSQLMKTDTFANALLFKVIPLALAFTLGLTAFKVI